MKALEQLGGRYRLEERIAIGGMGEVWRAHDEVLGRDVAVKVLRRDLAEDQSFVDRFRDEARHTAALSHPGIAAVHDYAESDGASYLVMELVDGEPLSAVLAAEGALSVERSLDIIAQVAVALQAAHDAGVVHRDIKPGNLLVRPDGTVKVTDFGIARAAEATSSRTQTGTVLGTAYYMAPEAVRGEPATAATDVYALGVVGYECLAGQRPFTAANPVAVATAHLHDVPPPLPSHVPREVSRLVLSCMAKSPAQRLMPASAVAERALQLRAALAPTVVDGTPLTALGPPTLVATPTMVNPAVEDDRPRWHKDAPGQAKVRRVMIGVAVLVLLLGFLVLRACDSTNPAAGPTPRSSPTAVATMPINRAAYVGRPVSAVLADLAAIGMRTTTRTVTVKDPSIRAGTVTDVTPTGSVRRGTLVTVTVAAHAPAPAPAKGKHGKGKDGHD